jgi:CheY-like chemotaxis protein
VTPAAAPAVAEKDAAPAAQPPTSAPAAAVALASSISETIRSSENLLSELDSLLAATTAGDPAHPAAVHPFSLRTLLESAVLTAASRPESAKLDLSLLIDSDVPDSLLADHVRLEHIFQHLYRATVTFTRSGELTLAVRLNGQSTEQTWIDCTLTAADCAIPPEYFSEEAQFGGPDGLDELQNAGLSLYISRVMLKQIGAQYEAICQPGEGARFQITIPLAKSPQPVPAEFGRPDVPEDIPFLLALSSPTSRNVAKHILGNWGYRVTIVDEPAKTVEVLRQSAEQGDPFQIVLLDSDLENVEDIQLAQSIIAEPGLEGVSVVLVAPFSQRQWTHEPILQGLKAVITSPILESDLRAAIKACFARQTSVPSASSQAALVDGRWALIAEDDPVHVRIATRLMHKMGYSTDIVSDGSEAIAAVSSRTYDVILMDCLMPNLDGISATQEIRKMERNRRTPIIAISANTMECDRRRGLDSGIDIYLTKPFTYEDLRSAVLRLVEVSV